MMVHKCQQRWQYLSQPLLRLAWMYWYPPDELVRNDHQWPSYQVRVRQVADPDHRQQPLGGHKSRSVHECSFSSCQCICMLNDEIGHRHYLKLIFDDCVTGCQAPYFDTASSIAIHLEFDCALNYLYHAQLPGHYRQTGLVDLLLHQSSCL